MEKINIAKLLKDCPQGMELDCTMFENVKFDYIKEDTDFPIKCFIENESSPVSFNKYGKFNIHNKAKCVIFPKGKTTWEGFVPPCKFNDGDIVINKNDVGNWIGIFHNHCYDKDAFSCYCYLRRDGSFTNVSNTHDYFNTCLATEEEKQILFDAIKENGYRWNAETKTLERLIEQKFKVGDNIRMKSTSAIYVVTEIREDCYMLDDKDISLLFKNQDQWEVAPNKFDINTLIPFESKVLVRDGLSSKWLPAIWGFYDEDGYEYHYQVVGGYSFCYCIPYEANKELLGTTDDCNDYFKTW